jgi:hypothetical protein
MNVYVLESIRNHHPLHLVIRRRHTLECLQALKCGSSSLCLVWDHSVRNNQYLFAKKNPKLNATLTLNHRSSPGMAEIIKKQSLTHEWSSTKYEQVSESEWAPC